MNCKKVQDYLSPYLDHVLSPEDTRTVEKHLEKCPICRQELEDLQETVHMMQTLPDITLPAGFNQQLRNKLGAVQSETQRYKEKGRLNSFRKFPYRWASLGMAAVLMLFLYGFISPTWYKSMSQSDIPNAEISQNEEKTVLMDKSQGETAKSKEAENTGSDDSFQDAAENNSENKTNQTKKKAADTLPDTTKNNEKSNENTNNPIVEKTPAADEALNKGESSPQRKEVSEASRSKINSAENTAPIYGLASIPPEEDLAESKQKLTDQSANLVLKIKKEEYEKVSERIISLKKENEHVLDVIFQNNRGEAKGAFTINVAPGTLSEVQSLINTLGSSVSEDVYQKAEEEYIYLTILIKEKSGELE